MSLRQIREQSENFKAPDAQELLRVIVLAMSCPDPAVGMELLGEGVGVVLGAGAGKRRAPEPTPLRPPGWEEVPADRQSPWDFSDPEMWAITRPWYRDTAEYHYAMAEFERKARGE